MAEKFFSYSTKKLVAAVWPAFLEPRAFKDKKNPEKKAVPKFGAHFCFPAEHPDIKGIREKALEAFRSEYPDVPLEQVRFPFATGEQVADKRLKKSKMPGSTSKPAEFFREYAFVLRAQSKYLALAVRKDGRTVELRTEEAKKQMAGMVYSGVKVAAEFRFKPYFNDTNETYGVTAYLQAVESHGIGKQVGGGGAVGDRFANVTGHETDDDPTDDTDY